MRERHPHEIMPSFLAFLLATLLFMNNIYPKTSSCLPLLLASP
jgi:hypothetical protein